MNVALDGYWAAQKLKLDYAFTEAPRDRNEIRLIKRWQHEVRAWAATPRYHAKQGEVHPLSAPPKKHKARLERDAELARLLHNRGQALWTLNADTEILTNAELALIAQAEMDSESIVYIIARNRLNVRNPHLKRIYEKLAIELNEYNYFGNGDKLLVEAAQRLARQAK